MYKLLIVARNIKIKNLDTHWLAQRIRVFEIVR